MFKKGIGVLIALSIVGFFGSGCSSKQEVVTATNQATTKKQIPTRKEVADEKIEQIKTNVIEEEKLEETTQDTNTDSTDYYINKTVSKINGQKVVLRSIHFKFDDYHLTDEMVVIANDNAVKIDKIVSQNPEVKIKLEGNCDEWGTDEYNYALGLKRAKTVKESLVKYGINPGKIVIVSYGESNPICSEHTITCWKKNRRVDYRLLP